jgi:REP element-mobilizing transposase RayT
MPRTARKKSESGIYHIILRGINRQIIFEDKEDKEKYLEILTQCKILSGSRIFGYCLMGNHIHMLIQEGNEDMGMFMRRIGARYVYWYNWKYKRCGHLFQDRYKSEEVDDDSYYLAVLRYIHRNPVKAGITKEAADFKWSSFHEYIHNNPKIAEIDDVLNMFDEDRIKAIEAFIHFHQEENEDRCLDMDEGLKLRDEEAMEIILRLCKIKSGNEIQKYDVNERNVYIKELRKQGISTRQLERLTGVSRAIILKL